MTKETITKLREHFTKLINDEAYRVAVLSKNRPETITQERHRLMIGDAERHLERLNKKHPETATSTKKSKKD